MKGVGAIFVMYGPLFTFFTLLQITYVSSKTYHKVFVYDDFKRGEPCHIFLTDHHNGEARFIQDGYTVTQYPLVVSEDYVFLLNKPGLGYKVIGEVYNVDDKMLLSLDFELNIHLLHFRRLESIQLINSTSDEKPVVCWTYFWKSTLPKFLKLTRISQYHSRTRNLILQTSTKRSKRPYIHRRNRKSF